jgi:hypothetical protein
MLICDALMIYRMVYSQSYHVIVSVMCPVFHLGVLKITLTCDAALKSMTDGMIDVPIAQPVLLRKIQSVIAILAMIVLLFMVVLFVIWTPLTQAQEGTALFDLSSLHRLWLTDVMGMYKNVTFTALYSLGLMTLGMMWAGILVAYVNGVFIAWTRLHDCRNLVVALKDRAAALARSRPPAALANRRGTSIDEADDDEEFSAALSNLVDAVNDCLSVRTGMIPMIRLGFYSVIFDVVLLTLFLVFSLLIVSCSSVCKTYGSEAYIQLMAAGAHPCVYSKDNVFSVRSTRAALLVVLFD